ncbi:hypothetical protein [Cryobacterium zhongshanensis]|uniref:Uncharacterized protein n=1 Tax=Cryobacterium zhongshanensis TaxID=2928153 RepID=A0AA41UGC8_9MICO|nr:hypothetical protein [Cryobacterium zhongshanensis]MCI4659588.1 hypothetical protein [Cryobacterium zhongshanensis]
MTQNTTKTRNAPVSTPAKRGLFARMTPVSLLLATKTVTLVLVLAGYYVLAFFAAVRVVPMTMGFVKSGTGVTLDMPLETVLSVWIVPALFLVALIFVLVLIAMRALWRLRARVVAGVAHWARGREADMGMTVRPPHTSPLGAKNIRKTSTSAA